MMDTPAQDRVRELVTAFLDAHAEQIVAELSGRPRESGQAPALSPALFDLAAACVREPSDHRRIAAIRSALAAAGAPHDPQPILSCQMALWSVLHRMLRDIEGPHRDYCDIHVVLALVGDIVDGILGALIDLMRSGDLPPPGWGTLVELGRTRREFQMLHQIVQNLLNAQDPPRMFEVLERGILGAFHIRSLTLAAVDYDRGFVEIVRSYPLAIGSRDPIGWRFDLTDPEIFCDVARTGLTEVIDGWDPRYRERIVQPDGSVIFRQRPSYYNRNHTAFFVPIMAGSRAVGVVATGSMQESKRGVLREIERMHPFLDQVGVTLSVVSETIERRKAEEASREAQERLQDFMDNANDLIQSVALDGRLLYVNRAWRETLGYTEEEIARLTIFDILHPDCRGTWLEHFQRVTKGEAVKDVEAIFVAKDGRKIIVTGSANARFENGQPVFTRGIFRDITERRKAEETRQEADRVRVLMEMAGAAAHEINQPLTAVVGLSQLLLLDRTLDPSLRRDLEIIFQAGQKISEIVHKMINLQQYVTKPYTGDARILDLDAASRKDP